MSIPALVHHQRGRLLWPSRLEHADFFEQLFQCIFDHDPQLRLCLALAHPRVLAADVVLAHAEHVGGPLAGDMG